MVSKYYYQDSKPVGLEWESGKKHVGDEANFLILAAVGITVIIAAVAYYKMREV